MFKVFITCIALVLLSSPNCFAESKKASAKQQQTIKYFELPQPEAVRKWMTETLQFLCQNRLTPEMIFDRFAPEGARKAEMALLTSDKPFYTDAYGDTTLELFKPYRLGIGWKNPRPGRPVGHIDVVLDGSAEIVKFEDFVAGAKLGEEVSKWQTHPLGDIQHQFAIRCDGDLPAKVIVAQIVWAGAVIGKVSEFHLQKWDSD